VRACADVRHTWRRRKEKRAWWDWPQGQIPRRT